MAVGIPLGRKARKCGSDLAASEHGGIVRLFRSDGHICKVYEVGTVDGKPYIAMELIEGQTLERAGALLSLQEKLQLLKDAAEAVHAAHEEGVIHRDLKPSTRPPDATTP